MLIVPGDSKTTKITAETLRNLSLTAPHTLRQFPSSQKEENNTASNEEARESNFVDNSTKSLGKAVKRSENISERRDGVQSKEKS